MCFSLVGFSKNYRHYEGVWGVNKFDSMFGRRDSKTAKTFVGWGESLRGDQRES